MPPLLLADPMLDTPLRGAPYTRNDLVVIEVTRGAFVEARVASVQDRGPSRFGLRWLLMVSYADTPEFPVIVDDNGENHTVGRRVYASTTLED